MFDEKNASHILPSPSHRLRTVRRSLFCWSLPSSPCLQRSLCVILRKFIGIWSLLVFKTMTTKTQWKTEPERLCCSQTPVFEPPVNQGIPLLHYKFSGLLPQSEALYVTRHHTTRIGLYTPSHTNSAFQFSLSPTPQCHNNSSKLLQYVQCNRLAQQ